VRKDDQFPTHSPGTSTRSKVVPVVLNRLCGDHTANCKIGNFNGNGGFPYRLALPPLRQH
jgi:hypothetical protein